MSEIRRLGNDLNSRLTPPFRDGKTEAEERETSCLRSHSRERSVFDLGFSPILFLLIPKVFALWKTYGSSTSVTLLMVELKEWW